MIADFESGKTWPSQDLPKEYLLCSDCEGQRGDDEKLAGKVWDFPKEIPNNTHRFELNEANTNLKLLFLSTLWLSSIARDNFYADVSLESADHEAIRRLLIANAAVPSTEFPVIGCVLVSPNSREVMSDYIPSPNAIKLDNLECWLYVVCGLAWVIATRPETLAIRTDALPEVGDWNLPVVEVTVDHMIGQLVRHFFEP